MNKIEIKCDAKKREKSKLRLAAFENQKYIDRVPVMFGVEARYLLDERGVGFLEYFETPENNFYHQLMNFKWRMEHIEDDFLGSNQINIFPDFQNTSTASLFNESCIEWSDTETPRIIPFINDIEDLRSLKVPDMNSGMALRRKNYIKKFKELAKDTIVTVNGENIPINIMMGWQESMFTGALAMLGENLLSWLLEYPDEMKEFFDMMTDTCILYEKEMMKLTEEKRDGSDTILDGAEMISPVLFKEFIVPYYNKFYAAFKGRRRGTHNCGNILHLLPLIRDELKITYFNGFGYVIPAEKMAEIAGNSFRYSGGINPMTIWSGSNDEVENEVRSYVKALGPYESYMVCDGYNIAPKTKIERLNGIVKLLDDIGLDF